MADSSFDFKGKKALVTGAGRGIGRAIVEALVTAGIDKVYALSKTKSNLDDLKSKLSCVEIICVDLQNWDETRAAVEIVEPVDFLINNAGINIAENFFDITPGAFEQIMNVNVRGIINVSQVICAKMLEKGGGVVVNVSSVTSKVTVPQLTVYSASKSAVDGLTRMMAAELAPKIRVNAVNPTIVWTDMAKTIFKDGGTDPLQARTALGRFAEVKEVVDTVLYLLSDGAAMVHGVCLPICGGFTTL